MSGAGFLETLESVVAARLAERPDGSYTARLASQGLLKVAQKVGEEGVELALAGAAQDDERVTAEAADLIFHLLVLLRLRGVSLGDVIAELERRHGGAASGP